MSGDFTDMSEAYQVFIESDDTPDKSQLRNNPEMVFYMGALCFSTLLDNAEYKGDDPRIASAMLDVEVMERLKQLIPRSEKKDEEL